MFIKNFICKHKTGFTFMFFGLLTTLVDYGFYFLFSILIGQDQMLDRIVYLWVNAASSFLAIIFAYVTNKIYVFHSKSWKLRLLVKEIPSFFGTRLIALLVSEFGIWFLVRICGLENFTVDDPLFKIVRYAVTGDILAKFIMSFISTALNYIFGKFLIFKNKKTQNPNE